MRLQSRGSRLGRRLKKQAGGAEDQKLFSLVGKGYRETSSAGEMVAAPTAHWTS